MKNIASFTAVLLILGSIHQANADNYKYIPYIGVDYTFSDISATKASWHNNAINFRVGSEYSSYFGTELFFMQSDADKSYRNDAKTKTSYRAYGLDIAAYLPMGCKKDFSIIATTGIGEYVIKNKLYPFKHFNEHGYGYRFGGGFKYALTKNWQTRLIARYIKFNHLDTYKHAMEYTAGVEYHF